MVTTAADKFRAEGIEQGKRIRAATAERLRAEGIEQGKQMMLSAADKFRAEGMGQGKAEIVTQVLQEHYGEVPPGILRRVQAAKPADLDAWAIRLFKGESPEAVFGKAARS